MNEQHKALKELGNQINYSIDNYHPHGLSATNYLNPYQEEQSNTPKNGQPKQPQPNNHLNHIQTTTKPRPSRTNPTGETSLKPSNRHN